jgi:PAS domain S-box-containing protein
VALPAERQPTDPVQRLFELSVDMLGTASADGYFTRLNPAWERTLGWSGDELMAAPFSSFVHPDDVDATLEQAGRLSGSGRPLVVAFENRYRGRDGTYRSLEWTAVGDAGR